MNSYRGVELMHDVGWWMLDLARATAGDKLTSLLASPADMLLKLPGIYCCWDCSKLVAFSSTNMPIYHKLATGHLLQAWARFTLQCFHLTKL